MIKIPNVTGKKYAVLGLGKSGLATAASLRQSGADVFVWDDKDTSRDEAAKAGYQILDFKTADLSLFDALLLSPGIPHSFPKPHPAVSRFKDAKIPIIGDIELLFRACTDAVYIGVTGTNGKSTTTALIGHILCEAGRKAEVGGNLGTPVLSFEPLGKDGIYVLELSSYQLELIEHNLLSIAVILNITPDHLARHGGMDGYIEAKKRIIRSEAPQTLILGIDEPETMSLAANLIGNPKLKLFPLSVRHDVADGIEAANDTLSIQGHKVLDLKTVPHLPGAHNAQNIGAAFAVCRAAGLNDADIVKGIQSFPGLAHRQQWVADIDGVRFVNDSKATNADAAEKALLCYENIYWIIGGQAKEGGLKGLEKYTPAIKHAYIIGEASQAFAEWCKANAVPHTLSHTLEKAVEQAAQQARADKIIDAVVLLSPACASWDQFTSFEDRGEHFVRAVHALPKDSPCPH